MLKVLVHGVVCASVTTGVAGANRSVPGLWSRFRASFSRGQASPARRSEANSSVPSSPAVELYTDRCDSQSVVHDMSALQIQSYFDDHLPAPRVAIQTIRTSTVPAPSAGSTRANRSNSAPPVLASSAVSTHEAILFGSCEASSAVSTHAKRSHSAPMKVAEYVVVPKCGICFEETVGDLVVVQCGSNADGKGVDHIFCKTCISRWAYVGVSRNEISQELISQCPTCKGTIQADQAAELRKNWQDANGLEEPLQDAPSSNGGIEDTELVYRDDVTVDGSRKIFQ